MKRYTQCNVYQASMNRIKFLFDSFDNVLVSFSGGKDSGLMLNLIYEYAKKNGLLNRLAVYHLDYEAQYSFTTDYVTETFRSLNDVRRFWLCLPVGANCGCKIDSSVWIPWQKQSEKVWCREMPCFSYVINEANCPFEIEPGKIDYSVQDDFCQWFNNHYGNTVVCIGIRAEESLDRQNLIQMNGWVLSSEKRYSKAYPIYDWKVQDIWTANGKFNFKYNKIYDLYYKAGLTINQMRVANPFHTCGISNLKLYRTIEPQIWGKLLNRINGVNFGCIYGGTKAFGSKNLIKPIHFTWEQYAKFLIETSPVKAKEQYSAKVKQYIDKWINQGYLNGIPDEADLQMEKKRDVPSWRKICKCILSNDIHCKSLGFTPQYSEVAKTVYHQFKTAKEKNTDKFVAVKTTKNAIKDDSIELEQQLFSF